MTELLCLLLKPALYGVSDPRRYWYLVPVVIVAWFVDVILAHTGWALIAGWPQRNEWTISDTLERLCREFTNPDQFLYIEIAKKINRVSPTGDHIKSVL